MRATVQAVRLRPPRSADRKRVRSIVEATGVFRPDEVAVALEVFDDAVRAPGADYTAIGAYQGDRLLGFVCYGRTPCTVATWDLYWIVVDPSAHRQGIGRSLLAATETDIATHGGRLLVVETSSRDEYAPTRAFYESADYATTARVPAYYAPGDDLVVYTKNLAPSAGGMAEHG